jgi:hypothetical protein
MIALRLLGFPFRACWLCDGPTAGVKVWMRVGDCPVFALACAEHRTRLELIA